MWVDIDKNDLIPANFKNVIEPILCTKIANKNGISISCETFNGSFFGEGIDNALVEVNASEIPILDGHNDLSAMNHGIEQKIQRQFIQVEKKVEIKEDEKFISIEPSDRDLIIDFEIVYKNPLIRTRRKEFKLSQDKLTEIYNSRTFCLYEDIDFIKSKGLAKGGSLENAIVVKDNEILMKMVWEIDMNLFTIKFWIVLEILCCLEIEYYIKLSSDNALTNKLLIKFFSDNLIGL